MNIPSASTAAIESRRIWDAVVIGAGPAGSVAARELARRGADVLLLDKATFPRPKVCGCCLNGAAIAILDELGLGHLPAELGAVSLSRVVIAAGRRTAELSLPCGAALSREAFDTALVEEAVASGAAFAPGTTARLLGEPDAGAVRRVSLARADRMLEVETRVVIVATGLAGRLNPDRPEPARTGSRLGAGTHVDGDRAPSFYSPGTIYMATGRGGYVGLARLEDGQIDVAAAFDPEFVREYHGLGAAAAAILAQTKWPAITDLYKLPWKGTPPLTRHPTRRAGHRLFAVGDAAGYVEPFTGEGMAWAIAGAAALAPIALQAIAEWDDGLQSEWENTHARLLGHRQLICRAAARVLRSPLLTSLAVRALSAFPFLAGPMMASLNRASAFPHGLQV